MNRQEAYQTLVRNYLARRKIPVEDREHLDKVVLDTLQNRDGLISTLAIPLETHGISKNSYIAYMDAQTLFTVMDRINQVPNGEITADDCQFKLTKEEREEIMLLYGEYMCC